MLLRKEVAIVSSPCDAVSVIARPECIGENITIDYLRSRLAWEVSQQGLSGSCRLLIPEHLDHLSDVHDFIQELCDAGYTVCQSFGASLTSKYDVIKIAWDVPDVSIPFQHKVTSVEQESLALLQELGVSALSNNQCFEHLTHVIGDPHIALLALRAIYAYTDQDYGDEERK